ncbi:sphingomyelin phosphodiesterase 5-like isoform X2 [Patagioenas fasciata]|uniref:sphingomyelin phosphodiesterase 5-like isoform X2 n=1 Tax=Patagioenas fasciata TaxID=372321 RepID=UPI003A99C871
MLGVSRLRGVPPAAPARGGLGCRDPGGPQGHGGAAAPGRPRRPRPPQPPLPAQPRGPPPGPRGRSERGRFPGRRPGTGVPLPAVTRGLSPAGHARVTGAPGQERGDVAIPLSPPSAPAAAPLPPAMLAHDSPFPSRALAALDRLAEGLLAPGFWAVNGLLDLRPTTAERRRRRERRCGRCRGCTGALLAGVAFAAVLLLSLPVTALGLLLWLPLQAARRPFRYRYTAGTAAAEPWDLRQPRTFTFLSANVCLLPSGLAKFSNLGDTAQRASEIARLLAPRPQPPPGDRAGLVEPRGESAGYGGTLRTPAGAEPGATPAATSAGTLPETPAGTEAAEPVLSERFPANPDFVCLQEVFDGAAASRVCGQLAGAFPHVLWDVGARGLRGGRPVLLGSGLLLASRFPPLAARYRPFPNGRGEDALAAKGLLVAQVLLGSARGRRVVGYIGCTHLQAPAADATTREAQLSLSLRWLQLFREEQEQSGDLVAFDVLCGDLNFDNCSRGDELNQRHELFQLYQDPCRRGPGLDAPWAIGTLLNYLRIYEEPVSTPEKMRRRWPACPWSLSWPRVPTTCPWRCGCGWRPTGPEHRGHRGHRDGP